MFFPLTTRGIQNIYFISFFSLTPAIYHSHFFNLPFDILRTEPKYSVKPLDKNKQGAFNNKKEGQKMISQGNVGHNRTSPASRLSFTTKFSYGLGDFASNMSWTLVTTFLMFYYTDVYGLTPAVIGLLLLIVRGWDAINDPIMGLIMERTRSRYGRFRPYLLYTPLFMASANILMFRVPHLGPVGKIIYAYATYLCLEAAFTAVNVPYGALATVMTQEHDERTTLNSFRMFSTTAASIVIGTLTLPLIQILGRGDMGKGFFLTAVIYSIISIPLFWLVFINCREVISPPEEQKLTLKDSLMSVIKNGPLILVLIYTFLSLSTIFGRSGLLVYYCIYNLKRPDLVSILILLIGVCNLIAIVATPFISEKLGKRMTAMGACLGGGIGLMIIFLSGYTDIGMIIFGTIVFGLSGFGVPMLFSLTADCVEYAEWKTDVRAEGAIYSVLSLIIKAASAFVGSVGMIALGALGYVPNGEQTQTALRGINIICNLVPSLMYFGAIIPLLFYIIDKKFYDRILKEISERRMPKHLP